jgi:hypothetical protein
MQGLAVGRIVHYVMGPEEYCHSLGKHRPAIIVETWDNEKSIDTRPSASAVNLVVFPDGSNDFAGGTLWKTSVVFSDAKLPGTWHWPERD